MLGGTFLQQTEEKITYKELEKPVYVVEEKEKAPTFSGTEYIALAGIDYREENPADNSDTMIIVQLNHDTKEIRMVSVYRDTFLKIEEGNYFKANASYNLGGAEGYLSMLNRNLDLSITQYITVDFVALQKLIDGIGGLDLTVTAEEAAEINRYNGDTAAICGIEYKTIPPEAGTYHLNGSQVVSYARIRSIDNDFVRTSRQRIVLSAVFEKLKESDLKTLLSLADQLLPLVTTNIQNPIDYVGCVLEYDIVYMEGFPYEKTTGDINGLSYVFAEDLEANVRRLHTDFGDIDYQPTEELLSVCEDIRWMTGH